MRTSYGTVLKVRLEVFTFTYSKCGIRIVLFDNETFEAPQ